jgi:hypothetical protein
MGVDAASASPLPPPVSLPSPLDCPYFYPRVS